MWRVFLVFLTLSACDGVAWNTTMAVHGQIRWAMLSSIQPGHTTETQVRLRWGNPTQIVREGAEKRLIYRNMTNPPGYRFPQFGDSTSYVVVVFQYGVATQVYSSDVEGCRATFPPRPPGAGFDNPTTVHPANCGTLPGQGETQTDGLPPVSTDEYLANSGKL